MRLILHLYELGDKMTQAFWSIDWMEKARQMDDYECQYVINQIKSVVAEKITEKIKRRI